MPCASQLRMILRVTRNNGPQQPGQGKFWQLGSMRAAALIGAAIWPPAAMTTTAAEMVGDKATFIKNATAGKSKFLSLEYKDS
jgi:hypothetical protein